MTPETKARCEDLAREFIRRISPWEMWTSVKILWTERGTYTLGGVTKRYTAVPTRQGVTLNASWCEAYSRDPRLTPNKGMPHGSGWQAMRARDQWRHDTHLVCMPELPSPWEPLLEMWDLGAMIDELVDDGSKEGPKCLLLQYDR